MKQTLILALLLLGAYIAHAQNSSLDYLKKFDGKYPSQVHLIEANPLKERLTRLLKTKYKLFKENLGVETPIEVHPGDLFTSGCMPHFCGSDESAICVMFGSDNVVVGIKSKNKYSVFSEKTVSRDQYPEKFRNWLDNK